MQVPFSIPKLYAIADAGVLARRGVGLREYAEGLWVAGVTLVQYRDKDGLPQEVLRAATVLSDVFTDCNATLIMNDRADFAVLAGFDGVHVGQGDLSPEDVKAVLAGARMPTLAPVEPSLRWSTGTGGGPTHRKRQGRDEWGTGIGGTGIVGVSTHTVEQVRVAEAGVADYVAIGPVFATGTKLDAEAAVGLEGVRRARALTTKPLVAIGGITRANARSVIDAGANSVAVISGLFVEGETVEKVARDFIELLG